MKITHHIIQIQKIVVFRQNQCLGYKDKGDKGVTGCMKKLNIRPSYQREFIYNDKQRNSVIDTIQEGFPLNVFYWMKNSDGSKYEVLDGQQRLISIGQYVSGEFSIKDKYFANLTPNEQNKILKYKLMVYYCQGTDREKLDWFERINIAGEKLTHQEIRNAVYSGSWVSAAKKYFSKRNCPAYKIASNYLRGSAIRQDYFETVINWICDDGNIRDYMSKHQHYDNAKELYDYFENVINWVKILFTNTRKEMKGIPFGVLYNTYKNKEYDPVAIEVEVSRLMRDEDVTNKRGIYKYIFTRDSRALNIRPFNDNTKRETFERQEGKCPRCEREKPFKIDEMEADHITPWSRGGKTISENCQMLCQKCNRTKSDI